MWVATDQLACASSRYCQGSPRELPSSCQSSPVYEDLKRAILQQVGLSPEQQRHRFRPLDLGKSGRPYVMAQQLRDVCRKWLVAEGSDVNQVNDKVVLEQFIVRLPKKMEQWVQCHRPTSLDSAIQLVEDQMVACCRVSEPLPTVALSPPSPVVSPSLSPSEPIPFPRSRGNLLP